jgi:hypothetical protein
MTFCKNGWLAMAKSTTEASSSKRRRKHFPIRCIKCGKVEVRPAVVAYEIEKNQDGKLYKLQIPDLQVNRCGKCGTVYLGADADVQISAALRERLGLLTPSQIRANLGELKLRQRDAAEQLGVAPETISRWLTGTMIQSRAMDNFLRVFFGCSEVRKHLSGVGQDRDFGSCVQPAPDSPQTLEKPRPTRWSGPVAANKRG